MFKKPFQLTLFIISLALYSCDNIEHEESLASLLLPHNYSCDTTYSFIDPNGDHTFYCLRKGKTNFLRLNGSGDTLETKKNLNSATYERKIYNSNKLASKSLAVSFDDVQYTVFQHNIDKNNPKEDFFYS